MGLEHDLSTRRDLARAIMARGLAAALAPRSSTLRASSAAEVRKNLN
jgi:hypothetical protein